MEHRGLGIWPENILWHCRWSFSHPFQWMVTPCPAGQLFLPRSSQMTLQPRAFTSPISDLQGGKQYPLLVGISGCRGESCRREVLSVGDLEDPPPDFRQKREEEGVCLQTWRWEMEPCVLTEAFQPCPRKAQKTLYFPQRRPGRGGRGVMREVKLSTVLPTDL